MTVWLSKLSRQVKEASGEPLTGVQDVVADVTTDSRGFFQYDFGNVKILEASAVITNSTITSTSSMNTSPRAQVYGINEGVVKGFALRSNIITISLGTSYSPMQSAGSGVPIRIMCKIVPQQL